ncbi:MAG TPA: peptidylprolyl isomerase [candidate division Zixibacteria bacterium]|nr:peptidylprolyl isomerase [candidate division Zixibacteria bacterium]
MTTVGDGKTVRVHYTGKLEDGTVFDSSEGREPLEVTVGAGMVIPGFEKGLTGMKSGDKKTITIGPNEAYGERREDLVATVERSQIPETITPEVGMTLQLKRADGSVLDVLVTDLSDESITLDANHQLAGETLVFDVEVVEVS